LKKRLGESAADAQAPASKFCSQCGTAREVDARFCKECGAKL